MTTRRLCPCRVRSQPSVFRKRRGRSTGPPSADGRGMGRDRTTRSRECRNRCGGLKQARGPRRYSRGLVAVRISCLSACPSVLGGPPAGQGRRLAARMLRDCLLTESDGSLARVGWRSPCSGTLGGRWRGYRVIGGWCGRNSVELSVHQSVSHGPDDDLLLAAVPQLVLYVVDGVADRR